MRQEDLVSLELDGVAENSFDEVDAVQGVVLQRVARVRRHRLVVAVDLVQRRVRIVRLVRSRSDDDLPEQEFGQPQPEVLGFVASFHRHRRLRHSNYLMSEAILLTLLANIRCTGDRGE